MPDHGTRAQYMREWRMVGPICRPCMIAASENRKSPTDKRAMRLAGVATQRAHRDLAYLHRDEYRALYRRHYRAAAAEVEAERNA